MDRVRATCQKKRDLDLIQLTDAADGDGDGDAMDVGGDAAVVKKMAVRTTGVETLYSSPRANGDYHDALVDPVGDIG